MYLLRFKEWPILTKIITISIVSVTFITLVILLYFMPLVEQKVLDGKKEGLKNVVDVALYRAKEEGRNRSVRFTRDMWKEDQVGCGQGLRSCATPLIPAKGAMKTKTPLSPCRGSISPLSITL